jgi:hypothetical protein
MSSDLRTGLSPFGGGSFADILAQVAGAVGESYQYDQKRKNDQIRQMLEQAKTFGLPGLRKLYADPVFVGLAKGANLQLTTLPEPSSEELLEDRKTSLIREFEAAIKSGKDPGVTRVELSKKYPDAAKATNFAIEPSSSTTNAMINAISKGLDPGQLMSVYNIVYGQVGGIENAPAADQAIAALGMSDRVQEQARLLRDKHNLMIQQAGLTGAKAKEINTLLDAKLEKLNADIALIREGKIPLAQAATLLNNYKAEVERDFGPLLAKAKVASLTSGSRLNDARAFYYTEMGSIKQLEVEIDRALGLHGGPKYVQKAIDGYNKMIRLEQNTFNKLLTERDKLADQLSAGAISKEEYETLKGQYDSDIKELRTKLRADMSEVDNLIHGRKSDALKPGEVSRQMFTPVKYPADYKGPKPQPSELYNEFVTKLQPEQWYAKLKEIRSDKEASNLPNEFWHQLTVALAAEFKRLKPNATWGQP